MSVTRNSLCLYGMDIFQKLKQTGYLSVRKLRIKCLASFEISMSSGNWSEFLWSMIFPKEINKNSSSRPVEKKLPGVTDVSQLN